MANLVKLGSALMLLSILSGCDRNQPTSTEPNITTAAIIEQTSIGKSEIDSASITTQLNELYAAYNQSFLELNPVVATFRGITGYNDRWANTIGYQHRSTLRNTLESYLQQAQSIAGQAVTTNLLAAQDMLNYEIFVCKLEMDLRGMNYASHLMPINQFHNPINSFAQLGSGQNAQPFQNERDYRNFISRADDFTVYIEQAIVNMREGIRQGYTQPRVLMKKVLPQLQAHLVDDITTSLFYKPLETLPDSINSTAQTKIIADYTEMISERLIPSIARLHHFIEHEYIPAARTTAGLNALPNGDDWYAYLVANTTSTDLSADEIHQIGLTEVTRIHSEIRKVMAQVEFDGSLEEFFVFTKNDSQFHFTSKDEMLSAYRGLRKQVNVATTNLFTNRPLADFEIRPVEAYRERSAASASYQAATPDGSRPGVFYLNTYNLPAHPIWTMTSLYLHEAVPGHHFQIATQQELPDMPEFRRFGGTTGYIEGWGLYAESLGQELGVYTDHYQYYGSLVAELWRAIRLVVDTGLHQRGWSREKVLDYMYTNAPVTEARAVSEAERFMAIPAQALAYKIGQLKIRALRNKAKKTLGDDFDVRAFHNQVLGSGSLPLEILETKIDRWIKSQ